MKILQIIPTNENWYAGLKASEMYSGVCYRIEYYDVVCWALIEDDDGDTKVTGMMGTKEIISCEHNDFFQAYYRKDNNGNFHRANHERIYDSINGMG